MNKDNSKPKAVSRNGLSVIKLGSQELEIVLAVLSALMVEVPCPRDARKSYLKEVDNRLRNNGVAFLAQARAFPTFGLKLLGGDLDGFPITGFKQAKGKVYPKLFAWYWAELERLSKLKKPKAHDFKRAQRVLCVLSFAKMIKLSSVNQIKKSLVDFEERVTKTRNSETESDPDEAQRSAFQAAFTKVLLSDLESLTDVLGYTGNLGDHPSALDLGSLSLKPCALKQTPALPIYFQSQFYKIVRKDDGTTEVYMPSFGFKDGPYGDVKCLAECAGKLRIIVAYNSPFVHSTGIYSRSRDILNGIPNDCSLEQAKGHAYIQRETARGHVRNSDPIVSGDLVAFSDNVNPFGIMFGLDGINLSRLVDYLLTLTITLPNGNVILPDKLLMGFKGAFELCSALHHYLVRLYVTKNYMLCGDDIVGRFPLETYRKAVSTFGWELNRQKTVVSHTAAVFCGEMYWFGHRVSPRVPKVHAVYNNGKLRKAAVLFNVFRDSVKNLNPIYNQRAVRRILRPLLHLLRKRWKGILLPTVPVKLRGLGMKSAKTTKLLSLVKNKATQRVLLMSIGIERQDVSMNRWFGLPIELVPDGIQIESPYYPALLKKGAVSLRPTREKVSHLKDVSAIDLYQAFEWYYDNIRLPKEDFGIGS